MTDEEVDISIVIPAYNEAQRLPNCLSQLISYCQNSSRQYEIIVVDEGSNDNTSEVANQSVSKCNFLKIFRLEENLGKGNAVKYGLLKARGKIALFMDADASTPASEIERNLHYFDEGYDIVVGSRVLKDKDSHLKMRWHRKLMGKIFNFCVRSLLAIKIRDTQCGFKMMKKETIEPIFSKMKIEGYGFDLELLFLAKQLGFNIKEAPISWHHVDGSKVNLIRDSLKMFVNIIQIRSWHRKS